MTQQEICTHQLLRLLGGAMVPDSERTHRYREIKEQVLGALTVINWTGNANDVLHNEIWDAARKLSIEEHRRNLTMKYLIGVEAGTRVKS